MCQFNDREALLLCQRIRLPAIHNADVVDTFQKIEVLEGILGFGCTRLIRLQCAFANHPLDLATAVGAVSTGAFIKRTLTQQNLQIRSLHILGCKRHSKSALGLKNLMYFIFNHVTADSRCILTAFIALSLLV